MPKIGEMGCWAVGRGNTKPDPHGAHTTDQTLVFYLVRECLAELDP